MNASATLSEARRLVSEGQPRPAVEALMANVEDRQCAVLLREILVGEKMNDLARPVLQQLAEGEDAEARVSRSVLALMGGEVERALGEGQAALQADPQLATGYNQMGRALQNAGRTDDAVAALQQAVELNPEYAEAWHNLGHVQRARGAMDQAVSAYRRSLALAPAYRSALLNLGITLFNLDQPEQALSVLTGMLEFYPGDPEALAHAGLASHLLGKLGVARDYYDQAISAAPQYPAAHAYLGVLLNEQMDSAGAIASLQTALQLDPADVDSWVELASAWEKENRLYDARSAIQRGMRLAPDHPGLNLEQARLERRNGNAAAALTALRSLDPQSLPIRLTQQYWFELGHGLDRTESYAPAMEAFERANQVNASSIRRQSIDRDAFGRRCAAIGSWLDQGAPGSAPGEADTAQHPSLDLGSDLCFLVGFPRAGCDLLEVLLNAHSGIATIDDKPTIERIIAELGQHPRGYPGALADLDNEVIQPLRQMYREEASRHLGESHGAVIVDKLPMRLLNLGLVHRLFPAAKILFSLRHPCDAVLSNFIHCQPDNETTVHFDTLPQSVAIYDKVMGLWQRISSTLPLSVHYTRYEDLIRNTEQEIQQLCSLLGVEPEDGMFDETVQMQARGPTRSRQPGEPVYRRSVGRWTHYQSHLEPFLPTLTPFIQRQGYSLGIL
ncbi:MAG: tetratricopeptide repeat protein [Xanthomonadales bacterium]|nr:tetratricopeptide repeat protein [Xanthomonadales bacterium]